MEELIQCDIPQKKRIRPTFNGHPSWPHPTAYTNATVTTAGLTGHVVAEGDWSMNPPRKILTIELPDGSRIEANITEVTITNNELDNKDPS